MIPQSMQSGVVCIEWSGAVASGSTNNISLVSLTCYHNGIMLTMPCYITTLLSNGLSMLVHFCIIFIFRDEVYKCRKLFLH